MTNPTNSLSRGEGRCKICCEKHFKYDLNCPNCGFNKVFDHNVENYSIADLKHNLYGYFQETLSSQRDTLVEVVEEFLNKKADEYNNKWGVDTCAALMAAKIQLTELIKEMR